MAKNKIAILLAAYNGKAYIKEQIDSILKQEGVAVKIFVSIDTSSDGTREWLESSYAGCSHVVLLEDAGRFGGAAKNFFRLIRDVDFSAYDFIAFADQDDIWYTYKLARAVSKLRETKADGYSSNVTAFWENGAEQLVSKAQPQRQYDYLFEAAGPGCTYVMTQALASEIRKCIIKEWDSMQTVWLHDWFCYAFARANGFKWIIDAKPSMRYRQHENNQVGVNKGLKAFSYRLEKVLFGGAMAQARDIACLIGRKETPFVKKWYPLTRFGFIKLAFYAPQCRRKFKEKILFFIACLLLSILGFKR
ncbi:MAG: glycosyltransferase [Erysipelotrichia bacterium]|nr:glycosyltransferase [Erysipelotrichia bacterium]